MKLVPIDSIKPNSELAKPLYDNENRVLLREGAILTETTLAKIKSLNIYSLHVVEEETREYKNIISSELRKKSFDAVSDIFKISKELKDNNSDDLQTKKNGCLNAIKNLSEDICQNLLLNTDATPRLGDVKHMGAQNSIYSEAYLKDIRNLSEDICHSILVSKDVSSGLENMQNMDTYTYQHCVNVATFSVVIGIGLSLPKQKLIELCIGGLLHDIGKVFIGDSIIQKPGKLTDEEFKIIQTHPQLGYDYIKNMSLLTTGSKMVVLQHHEKVDGTGYPNSLVNKDINFLAKIVAIADVYDALTSNRPYKDAMPPNDAFEFILSKADTMFDFQLTKVFSRIIIPYPEGSLVRLSNGDLAIVKKTHPLYPLRPLIKIIESSDETKINTSIDLSQALSLVLKSIERSI
ncbi:MAG: HD-GYP domain-containing protein [Sarcina sp.]